MKLTETDILPKTRCAQVFHCDCLQNWIERESLCPCCGSPDRRNCRVFIRFTSSQPDDESQRPMEDVKIDHENLPEKYEESEAKQGSLESDEERMEYSERMNELLSKVKNFEKSLSVNECMILYHKKLNDELKQRHDDLERSLKELKKKFEANVTSKENQENECVDKDNAESVKCMLKDMNEKDKKLLQDATEKIQQLEKQVEEGANERTLLEKQNKELALKCLNYAEKLINLQELLNANERDKKSLQKQNDELQNEDLQKQYQECKAEKVLLENQFKELQKEQEAREMDQLKVTQELSTEAEHLKEDIRANERDKKSLQEKNDELTQRYEEAIRRNEDLQKQYQECTAEKVLLENQFKELQKKQKAREMDQLKVTQELSTEVEHLKEDIRANERDKKSLQEQNDKLTKELKAKKEELKGITVFPEGLDIHIGNIPYGLINEDHPFLTVINITREIGVSCTLGDIYWVKSFGDSITIGLTTIEMTVQFLVSLKILELYGMKASLTQIPICELRFLEKFRKLKDLGYFAAFRLNSRFCAQETKISGVTEMKDFGELEELIAEAEKQKQERKS